MNNSYARIKYKSLYLFLYVQYIQFHTSFRSTCFPQTQFRVVASFVKYFTTCNRNNSINQYILNKYSTYTFSTESVIHVQTYF